MARKGLKLLSKI